MGRPKRFIRELWNIMPYIKEEDRAKYNGYIRNITNQINNLLNTHKDKNTQMAYVIYKLIKDVYDISDWDIMSNSLKVLEDVKLEFFRRVIAPHADGKIIENGDI